MANHNYHHLSIIWAVKLILFTALSESSFAWQANHEMKDIQNQVDHRRINIKKVGVKTITYPITVLDKAQSSQRTIATINMYVNLPHHFKGTHMSRFIEILNRFHGKIDMKRFSSILEEMKLRLDAEAAHLEMTFPFFLQRDVAQFSHHFLGQKGDRA